MSAPEFILKTTPPRIPRTALEREPLQRIWANVRERTTIVVIAPAGFGKTTLLAQWRRNWLKQGALVAWLGVDAQDDPTRFTLALLSAVSSASGRPAFDALMAQYAAESDHDIDALTGLLAEIAFLGTETVLMIDDAERLPDATVRTSLQYLLHNAPPNLHVVVSSRVPLPLQTWELAAKGNFATIGPDDLHLQLDESTAVLGKHFGQRLNLDQCTRLHELTGGWPLGLQLVAATIEREPDLAVAIDSLSARRGDIERYFFESLLTRLPAPMTDFLIRVAILDHLAADLCEAVTGHASAGQYIARLMVETPILSVAGLQDWVRLHPLVRDFLLSRFEQLPMAEQQELHARASHWFAERQRFHEAACHALASGNESLAHAYAERALWTLTLQGKLLEAREWLDRIPPEVVAADVDLRLVGAWIMAIGERNAEALEISQAILLDPATNPQRRFVAARAAFSAAAYGDRLGLMPAILADWLAYRPEPSASIEDPIQALAYANGVAFMALHAGETQRVRQLIGQVPANVDNDSLRLPIAHRLMIVGLSHLWDGEASRAEAALWPALVSAERIAGRRSMVASMYAAMVAAALLERDQPTAAQALLAHRLDVIERHGAPDVILLAYRTLAYVALSQGDERRALNILESLGELGERRQLPRLMLHGFAERIRLHSLRGRSETVESLLQAMAELEDVFGQTSFSSFQSLYKLTRAIATTYAALARNDLDECDRQLEAADALANQLHRGRDALTIRVLRAVVVQRRHADNAMPLLAEAVGLAAIRGCDRLLADTHPLAVQMGAALHAAPADAKARRTETEPGQQPYSALPERAAASRSGLLTTKETEVLILLDKGMSNKLIARAMEISDETVKWHIKNLFLKLAAGTRKHAVDRARLLGLLVH
ncbi:LuxR C-terminal-related transcriptional regulator [Lysobacter sp. CFH 32150]|uniref:LuxR C-terminal-related transcriptional regulator n=1 Tax=Lysobacter sp. CFH 32150 TaxID=2927128 RepID=UPI001FA6FB3F|nr:LuxR C-terminal-related transcriptional regulator [Lysobacter sp. CFH 32150]MCI4568867.1 LuxR C-terminal-related transcriptional regulator [Lysobacter sp. CFH 32150]